MTLTGAQARWQLNAGTTPTNFNVVGPNTVGEALNTLNLTNGDIIYSVGITATGATDVATLTLSSGVCAQTTGTPTIENGGGKDFEGETLTTLVTLEAVLIQTAASETAGDITIACSNAYLPDCKFPTYAEPNALLFACATNTGGITSPGTIAVTFAAIGDALGITVIGKST